MNFKTSIFSVFVILFVLATANLSEAFATVAVTPTADANTLANALAGPGVTIVPASPILTGGTTAGSECSGTFTGGASAGIGIPSGIILTSGFASNAAVTPNTDDDITGVTGGGADADLDALIGGGPTFDKCVLEFYITTSTGDLFFNYAFASDEYNEFVFSFNDVFGLFVDGTNIALAPPPAAPGTPVSINNVNGGNPFGALNAVNPTLYNNNDPTDGGPFVSLQYDGYTNTFTASKIGIGLGTHHVKLAIADAFDLVLDSAVFIQEGSFTGIDTTPPVAVSAKIIGPTQAQIVYSENAVVTGEAISGNYDFLVVAGEPRIIDSISGSGTATHTLTFSGGSAVNTDATGFVTINLSGGETVEDSAGNAIASDTLQPLTDGQEPIPTSVILDPITDPYTDDKFTVTGKLINDNTGRGIAGKIVKFDGTGTGNVPADVPGNVEGPPDATTSSFTVNDSPGIEIDDSTGDNILRLNEGATIDFPSNPPQVILLLSDMGFATFDVQVTTLGFPTSFTATGVGQDSDVGAFILTDADGISSIEITDISDGTAGITRVEAFNSQLVRYIDEEFDDAASGPSPQSFAEGSFFSIGTAQSTFTTTELTVDAHFDGDESYDPSASEPCGEEEECTPTNIQTYNVLFTTAAGFGGAVPFISSNGGGFTNTFDCPDPDGDSLCTSWETTGIPVAGEPNLMLPGADPQKKNIYVEVDYFTGRSPFDIPPGYTTTPMDDVRTAFANAPVSNPTPSTNGIILTVEQGQQITQSVPVLNVWTDTDASTCNDFDCLKALYFGNPGDSVARKNARAQAYHYFIFANSLPGGSSGIAEVGQNDGVVALGGAGFNENQNQQVSGTFMHELGHNLNLDHGGPANVNYQDRSINCKPNHDSVMSYSRQLPNLLSLPSEWRLDYSDGGLSPNSSPSSTLNFLKESGGTPSNPGNIAESNGNLYHHDNPRRIDPEAVPWLIWGTPSLGSAVGLSSPAPQTYLKQQARAAGVSNNVDWNGNGVATDPGTHLKRDLNGFGFYGCESGSFSTYRLKNYDEWNELNYNFRGLPGGSYDAARPFDNSYSLAVPDIDAQIVDQQQLLSAYHNALIPWKADSSLKIKKGIPIPIDIRLFDGANNPLNNNDGTVSYELFKSGDSTVKASGSLFYSKLLKTWVTAIHPSKITSKGTWYIELTLTTPEGTQVTKDKIPTTNPTYTNNGNIMSLKVEIT